MPILSPKFDPATLSWARAELQCAEGDQAVRPAGFGDHIATRRPAGLIFGGDAGVLARSDRNGRVGQSAEAAIAPVERGQSFCEIVSGEVGPEAVDEAEFGVGALPQEEVGDALLAAGADQEIDVWASGVARDQPREAFAGQVVGAADRSGRLRIASRPE